MSNAARWLLAVGMTVVALAVIVGVALLAFFMPEKMAALFSAVFCVGLTLAFKHVLDSRERQRNADGD